MRVLGIDFGQRRIGLALSDASGTLARPWQTISAAATPRASADAVADLFMAAAATVDAELSEVTAIVVGVPRRLNGDDTDQTAPARAFAAQLQRRLPSCTVREQDERLSSHEADQRLAVGERDWRRRKEKLDAAAAAVILQDYLDSRMNHTS